MDNFTNELVYMLPPDLVSQFSGLITLLQAVGIAVIAYVLFSIINLIFMTRKRRELEKINQNLEEIKVLLGGKPNEK